MTTETTTLRAADPGLIVKHDGIDAVFLTGPADTDEVATSAKNQASALIDVGYIVSVSHELTHFGAVHTGSNRTRMQVDSRQITMVDAVAVMPGWETSKAAHAHVTLARSLEIPVIDAFFGDRITESDWAPVALSAERSGTGETRVTSSTGGAKGQKEARFDLLPTGPLKELAVLYGRGAIKYDETNEDANWKRGYAWSLSYAALLRHLQLWWNREEDHDPEMGVKHLANVAWHAFNLMWFMENRTEFDDRPQGSKNADGTMTGESYAGAQPTPQWILDKIASKG